MVYIPREDLYEIDSYGQRFRIYTDPSTPTQQTPLLLAANSGNPVMVRDLLAAGADPNARDSHGQNALLGLAKFGRTRLAESLELMAGYDDIRSANTEVGYFGLVAPLPAPNSAYLRQRADAEDGATARALIEAGTSINTPDNSGQTPLQVAVIRGNPAVVEALLEAKANTQSSTPLLTQLVTSGRRQQRIKPALTKLQIDLLISDEHIESKRNSSTSEAQYRLRAYQDRARLLRTWGQQDALVAAHLVQHGVKVDERDKFGLTPLMRAVRTGQLEVAQTLIQNGADVNATDNDGFTVLMQVVIYGQRRGELKPLSRPEQDAGEKKALVESHNRHANAIRQMWGREDAAMVKLLLNNKANPSTKDKQGRTAADLAKQVNHPEALGILKG